MPFATATASWAPRAAASSALEGLALGPEDEPAGVEDPGDGRVQLGPEGRHVGGEVDEGHRRGGRSQVVVLVPAVEGDGAREPLAQGHRRRPAQAPSGSSLVSA